MAHELTRREKLAIVRKHYHEGKKQHTIARELTRSQQEVGRVLHQFVTTGDVESHWRSGRPSVVTDRVGSSLGRHQRCEGGHREDHQKEANSNCGGDC